MRQPYSSGSQVAREAYWSRRGRIGAANIQILLNALNIALVIVKADDHRRASLVFVLWFRAWATRARYQPGFVFSGRIELIVWAIPLLVILFLGGGDLGRRHTISIRSSRSKHRKSRSRCRSSRSIGNGCSSIPSCRVASVNDLVVPVKAPALLPHLRERDEYVLCAAARQHGRDHERYGHPVIAAGRPDR